MIRRPGAADHQLTIFQLAGSGAVAGLILFYLLVVHQVGDIDQHAAGVDFLTAHFFFQRAKKLVHLHRNGARFCLALAVADSFLAQLGEVNPAGRER